MSTPFYTNSGAQSLAKHRQYDAVEARAELDNIIARLDDLASVGGGVGIMFKGRAKSARQVRDRITDPMPERDRLMLAGFIRQNLDVIERAES